jgi:O-phosphoseryl-tRNA(Sec) kinase
MEQFLLILCGLPASGKTTLAHAIKEALCFDVDIVASDDWRDAQYYTDWRPEKEGIVRRASLARIDELVKHGKSVIYDDTNYYTSMRHELFEIAIENRCGFVIIHVTTPVTTALQWNKERPDTRIPDSVIEDIFERFDNPGRRYLWDNSDLEVDMEKEELESVVQEIVEILDNLEPAIQPQPRLITDTEFERLDVETRLIVSKFLNEHPELRGNRKITEIRRNLLKDAIQKRVSVQNAKDELLLKLDKLL